MKYIRYFKIYESCNKKQLIQFLIDLGFFFSINLSHVTKMAINTEAENELNKMQHYLNSCKIINNKTFTEIMNHVQIDNIDDPKYISVLFHQIKRILEYVEPRIAKFVIDGDKKKFWLNKIKIFKNEYIKLIS
jgi:hypothetical protein